MISAREYPTSTYDAILLPISTIRKLYAGLPATADTNNATVIDYYLLDDFYNIKIDFVITSGSYPSLSFWNLPATKTTSGKPKLLSMKQAQALALRALVSAEERRQQEREAEAKYWSVLE